MKTLNFRDCTLDLLDRQFNLCQTDRSSALEQWLAHSVETSPFEHQNLRYFQSHLRRNVHDWNEQELTQNFIGPIFAMVNFTTDHFNLFAERSLNGQINETILQGTPDGMIAAGRRSPTQPYFCFQEYKRERDPKGDPAGQCLAAMLVAQVLNQHKHPIYGCHIIGEMWRFMVLQGTTYTISRSFVASSDADLDTIFRVLKVLKQIIVELSKKQKAPHV